MLKTTYDITKRQNGENFACAIRNYDERVFDIPNLHLPELTGMIYSSFYVP